MAFKMRRPSIHKGTAAHRSALKHIVDDNKEHQNQFGDLDSAHDKNNPQTPEEHKGYKNEDLITREDTGPEAGADYNEPDSATKKRSPAKQKEKSKEELKAEFREMSQQGVPKSELKEIMEHFKTKDEASPTKRLKEGERKTKKTVRGSKIVENIGGKRYATKYRGDDTIRKTKGEGYRTKHSKTGKLIQEKQGGKTLKEYKPGSKISYYDHAGKSAPVKRAAWKGKKAHLKRNIDERPGAGLTVDEQLDRAKKDKKWDLKQAKFKNIKKDAWSKGKGARGRNTQLEFGYRSVLGKEPSMRPKTKDVKREIRQKYRDIKKEGRTVKKHQKILREDSIRGKKLRAHTLRTKRSKALQEGRKLSAKDYNIKDLEREVGYEKGRNTRGRQRMPKKVAERYGVDPKKSMYQYKGTSRS